VGILGSVAAIVLGSNPVVTGMAVGILAVSLLVIAFRVLGRASRRIDGILEEELRREEKKATRPTLRKSA
jgi:Na+-transporting methylmalonyl-CoA/oxaloacetate decarboxylase gamma subunit